MKGGQDHLVMTRTHEHGDDPLCNCALHDWDTRPDIPVAEMAWSDEPSVVEPRSPWRRTMPWVAVTALVCGTTAACLAASSSYGVTGPGPVAAKQVDITSTISATAPPPPPEPVSVAPPPPPPPVADTVAMVPTVPPQDRWLIDVMTDDGFIITDPPAVVAQVHHACSLLRAGETPRQADKGMAASMHTTLPAAAVLVAEAQSLYADECGKGR
jgi:hypothetical protein